MFVSLGGLASPMLAAATAMILLSFGCSSHSPPGSPNTSNHTIQDLAPPGSRAGSSSRRASIRPMSATVGTDAGKDVTALKGIRDDEVVGDVIELRAPRVHGLSGLTRDDRGNLWTISERTHDLVEVAADGQTRVLPIANIPEVAELESLAFIGRSPGGDILMAIGTEGQCIDNSHRVLFAEIRGERAFVVNEIALSLDVWNAQCDDGLGIEGLCRAGDALVGVVERPESGDNGERYALVGVMDVGDVGVGLVRGPLQYFRLHLASDTGKISGLHCELSAHGIDVVAIERHFEVSQLVRFSLPRSEKAPSEDIGEVNASAVFDLGPYTDNRRRNFEGITIDPQGNVSIVVDNHWKTITGPNELVHLRQVLKPAR